MITRKRSVVLFLFVLLFSISVWADTKPPLRVTFLDVGQGDSIMIRTADKNVLIDAGDDRFDVANAVLIPFCKKEGITKIDTCVISHPHRDHFGGYLDLVNAIPIGEFIYSIEPSGAQDPESSGADASLYTKLAKEIQDKKIPYRQVTVGDSFDWGHGVTVELLHSREKIPASTDASSPAGISANEHSLIFKVTAGTVSYLFTGDAEKGAENTTLTMFHDKLKSTVLKAGHHGSRTSSSAPFMDLVRPDYGVISCGIKNPFGHPNQETLDTYAYYKMKVFRTDQDGTVDSYTDGQTIHFTSNQSPLAMTAQPQLISLTPNSATIQWTTNKPSDSQVQYGVSDLSGNEKIDNSVTVHTLTLSGLKPGMAYKYQAVSHDSRVPDQVVNANGTFSTPASDGTTYAKISSMKTSSPMIYMKDPFQVSVTLANPSSKPVQALSLELYHTSMSPDSLLGQQASINIPAGGSISQNFPVTISWLGNIELLAVLKAAGKIIDTSSLSLTVQPKLILVDCAHGNADFYKGRFSGLKMDLDKNLGITLKDFSKPISADTFQDAFVVIIPEPSKDYADTERAALKDYVNKGGSVLLFSKANWNNQSHPQILNPILETIGSSLRFNADEFCDATNNIGYPWGAFIHTFPSPLIQGVSTILVRSCCSLLNNNMKGLTASKNVQLFGTGDDDSYDVNAGSFPIYIYASQSTKLPIPIAAGEDLGSGRVSLIGEELYDAKLYAPGNKFQVAEFNRSILTWLSQSRAKTLVKLLKVVEDLDQIPDAELRASRYEGARAQVHEMVNLYRKMGRLDYIRDSFAGAQGAAVSKIKDEVRDNLKFQSMQGEGTEKVQEFLRNF
ncbi:MAG: MBL fold metallo-hydrolase [Candidatus Riflebacteria bacterium]|nr:MBL fold metallo-hydrolase [Candidatus Riflebacteria bacterium]